MRLKPHPNMPLKTSKGFTLIELLVVISIIGLLSSIVLASLNTARNKASDAAVREQALQLATIMELEFSDTNSYEAIKAGGGWWGIGATCSGATGTYGAQANRICTSLVKATGNACSGNYCVYFAATSPNASNKYTILSYLPGESARTGTPLWFCVGSSGARSISVNGWDSPGCYNNP